MKIAIAVYVGAMSVVALLIWVMNHQLMNK
jgi:hypothetical protein